MRSKEVFWHSLSSSLCVTSLSSHLPICFNLFHMYNLFFNSFENNFNYCYDFECVTDWRIALLWIFDWKVLTETTRDFVYLLSEIRLRWSRVSVNKWMNGWCECEGKCARKMTDSFMCVSERTRESGLARRS